MASQSGTPSESWGETKGECSAAYVRAVLRAFGFLSGTSEAEKTTPLMVRRSVCRPAASAVCRAATSAEEKFLCCLLPCVFSAAPEMPT